MVSGHLSTPENRLAEDIYRIPTIGRAALHDRMHAENGFSRPHSARDNEVHSSLEETGLASRAAVPKEEQVTGDFEVDANACVLSVRTALGRLLGLVPVLTDSHPNHVRVALTSLVRL